MAVPWPPTLSSTVLAPVSSFSSEGNALQLACRQGLRALRSHIDSLGPGAACSWQALLELKDRWRERIELQLVALVPIQHWATAEGATLAQEVAASGGLLGGVLVPPFTASASKKPCGPSFDWRRSSAAASICTSTKVTLTRLRD